MPIFDPSADGPSIFTPHDTANNPDILGTGPVVYVMQQPTPKNGWTPDLGPATQYGRLAFVFDAEDRPHGSPVAALKKARTRLAEFDGERDYLLWPNFGDMASMWVVIALLTHGGWKKLRYLYWKRHGKSIVQDSAPEGYYFPVEINLQSS